MASDDALHGGQPDAGAREIAAVCRRWNGANSLSACFMSKPAPLSRTKNAAAPSVSVAPSSMRGGRRLAGELPRVAEQVLEHDAQQRGSASAVQPGSMTTSTWRSRFAPARSSAITLARQRAEVDGSGGSSLRVTRDSAAGRR